MALSITRNYADNTELTEAQLDALCDSIETFVNVTGLTGDNIQDNSITAAELQTSCITEAKLAANAVTTTKILDNAVTQAKLAAALQALLVPTATINSYAGDTAPTGWLLCDGNAYSRTTYAPLFAVVGVRFGSGDGTTTFNVPDLRGRFIRGADGGSTRDPDAATRTAMNTGGATTGVGSVQGSATSITDINLRRGGKAPEVGTLEHTDVAFTPGSGRSGDGAANIGTSTETRPLNAALNFIIKT